EVPLQGNIGTVYAEQGRYDDAQTHYEASLTLAQELGLVPDQAVQFSHLSDLAAKRGNYLQALDYAEQSLTIYRDIGARIGERTVLEQLGNVYRAQGDFADALAKHEEALALAQTLGDQDDEAYALLALGKTYLQLGQYEQATQFYQSGLQIFRQIGSVIGEANALRFLGNAAVTQAQPAQALALYEQALTIYQDSGSVTGEHLTLMDMGLVQRQLGNLTVAETTLEEALAIQRQIGAQANEGVTLVGLALVRHEQDTPQAALDLLQEALAWHQALGDRPNEAATLSHMGQLLAEQAQPELAITLLKQSVNLYESIRGDLRTLDTELQTSYTDSVADTYRTLADLLLAQNRILEAQRVLDLLKIQELDEYFQDVQRSSETASGVDFWQVETDLLTLYQQVLDQATELQALEAKSSDSLTSPEQQRLRELQAARDQAEGWFYDFLDDPTVIATVDQIRTSSRGQNLEPENFPDLANNLRLLPQKTAALYPLILEDRLELVLVMPEGPPLRYPVEVSSQALNQAIVNFGQALKTPSSDIEPLAQQLYQWLIGPLAMQLDQANIEAIIYAPDGALRYIPLAALHDGEQYLAQQFSISHITAASLTDLNVQPQSQDRQLLAAACAECEFTISAGETEFTFPDLPFTEVEVKTLAEQVDGVDVLLNQEFNAEALNNLSGYDIVHLATHAAFVTGSPDESFIVFGSGETINLRNIKREWTLDNTELVVLSACETAVGSTDLGSGIEILGLGYRIEQAGAQATLASLWRVSDGGTQKLMQAFYDALQQGMGKSAALQAAQQAMITGDFSAVGGDRGLVVVVDEDADRAATFSDGLSHPYYWAPFILIGNGL
ncbi:MAG: CHAT domain-containing protein, partial [Cyanobacteria bacterium P01_F01_bin.86]